MLNLLTGKAHQLFLTPCSTTYSDMRFLQVIYDDDTGRYSIVTIHRDSIYADNDADEPVLPFEANLIKSELITYTLLGEFTNGLKNMLKNILEGRVVLD